MGNADWIYTHLEACHNGNPLPSPVPLSFPGTINHHTLGYGAALWQATFPQFQHRIPEVTEACIKWLERFREEGLFLREGLSITYSLYELLGLLSMGVGAKKIKDASPDPQNEYLYNLLVSTLAFFGRICLEFRTVNGYVITTGPRWKHDPWLRNLNGFTLLAHFLEPLPKDEIKYTWLANLLYNEHNNFWARNHQHNLTRLIAIGEGKGVINDVKEAVRQDRKVQGRLSYPVYWTKENGIRVFSPWLPDTQDDKGMRNFVWDVGIGDTGRIEHFVEVREHKGKTNTANPSGLEVPFKYQGMIGPDVNLEPFPVIMTENKREVTQQEMIEAIYRIFVLRENREEVLTSLRIN